MTTLLDYMKTHPILLDGGMGTLLQQKGLKPGEKPETWNLLHPEIITEIHKAYLNSGSNIISTNTFGANALHYSSEELQRIIPAAVRNARTAQKEVTDHPTFVALDIGPSGKMLRPYGDLDFEEAVSIFKEIVLLGVSSGVDLIFIETMNDSYETKAALLAAKENADLPVFVSNAYDSSGKLLTGASPAAMVALLEGMRADAIGVNCSLGPDKLLPIVEEYLALASVPVLVKPNAGLPSVRDGKTYYDIDASSFAATMETMFRQGAHIMGGCCGTTPEYISALHTMVQSAPAASVLQGARHDETLISSYTHAVSFRDAPILIGERINPTGKKRFKKALIENDIDYVLKEAIRQEEKGVHVLDVNVGLPEIQEDEMLPRAVTEIQAVTDLPLQIDTANFAAMEKALRLYNGKALVNSVNGTQKSMDMIFPLVKKYGGCVICLTLDESGIPDNAQQRVEIAKKIIAEAAKYGIQKKDLIFDTLAMTISAAKDAAKVTLEALSRIKHELGCHTSLGVSNISFGLPNRDAINSTFFVAALNSGLSAAIMNPDSDEMMKAYYAYQALSGKDPDCARYIAFMEAQKEKAARQAALAVKASSAPKAEPTSQLDPSASKSGSEADISPLKKAIIKGLKREAADLTKQLLSEKEGLVLINEEIIPALDVVGKGFEKKTVYLPQLLMSAEAASASFEQIRLKVSSSKQKGQEKYPIVIATVKGDIHDIGKNIVRLLLENYGYAVTDLGKDVDPSLIVQKTLELKAPLVGLSALMTTTVPAMEETIRQLKKDAPFAKIMVGGAVLTEEYAASIGADHYAKDAMASVRYAESLLKA